MIGKLATPLRSAEFWRYFAISVVALLVDMTTLLVAAKFMYYLWAATIGFSAGAVVSYFLSVRWAFNHRRMGQWPLKEFSAYTLIGLAGLGINNLVIFLAVETVALPLPVAKAMAAVATFIFNYITRKQMLFTR